MCMSNRIKQKRIEMNLTQEELANALGLQKSAIAKYENGRVENIKRSNIEKMAKVLECKPSFLMGWDEELIVIEVSPTQSTENQCLMHYFNLLNKDGQKKLCERAEELLELGYTSKAEEKSDKIYPE